MTKREYIKEVIREIRFIEQNYTSLQKSKLDISILDSAKQQLDVYGLAFSDCFSRESNTFINLFNPRFGFKYADRITHLSYKGFWGYHRDFTPLEVFMNGVEKFNPQIIQYIRNEIKELPKLTM